MGNIISYTDDTAIMDSNKDKQALLDDINSDIVKITLWF